MSLFFFSCSQSVSTKHNASALYSISYMKVKEGGTSYAIQNFIATNFRTNIMSIRGNGGMCANCRRI